jgi:hypothetical protein
VLYLAVGGQRVLVGIGVGVGPTGAGGGHVGSQTGQLVLQVGDVGRAPQHLGDDGPLDLLGQLLGQVADAAAPGDVDLTRIGLLQADDDLQDRGLADAVAADERDPPARHQPDRHVGEEGAPTVGLGQPGDRDHARAAAWSRAQR